MELNLAQSVKKQTIVAKIVFVWYRNMNLFPFLLLRITRKIRID